MAKIFLDLCEDLLQIRKYLVKKGQSRYKGTVASDKLQQAQLLFNRGKELFSTLSTSKDQLEIQLILETHTKTCSLFCEIVQLCTLPILELKMEFDLKTACGLIPVLDNKEDTTKRLIDAVEMYADMLNSAGQQLLIKFVVKGRLSENAKLRVNDTYSSVGDMITDFRKKLLTTKSFTAIHNQIQSLNQGFRSIDDYGSQLEKLLTELNISQSEGDSAKCAVLKPINEKMIIKKFTDGLRNEKLSTIVAARNYTSLKDAIQAAKDESTPSSSSSTSRPAEVMKVTSTYRGKYNIRPNFRGRSRGYGYQNPFNNKGRYQNNYNNVRNSSNRYQGYSRPFHGSFRGRSQYNRPTYSSNSRRGGQGFYN